MKKFTKENKLTLAIVFIIILIVFILFLLLKKDVSSISDQQNCSKKAEEVFNKNQKGYIAWLMGSDYKNHFNKKMNKCFVVIDGGAQNIEYVSVLYDAYENKELGNVHTMSDVTVNCGLYVSDDYKSCGDHTKEQVGTLAISEFNNLLKDYMEN